jgi:hypothetical protein
LVLLPSTKQRSQRLDSEKLRIPQLDKTFPAFYVTLSFTAMFTTASHLFVP